MTFWQPMSTASAPPESDEWFVQGEEILLLHNNATLGETQITTGRYTRVRNQRDLWCLGSTGSLDVGSPALLGWAPIPEWMRGLRLMGQSIPK